MIIKRLICYDVDQVLDIIIKELINKNISYVIINNGLYFEIHFNDYIYQIYNIKIITNIIKNSNLNNIIDTPILKEIQITEEKTNKMKSGYKRYTKKDIKRGNIRKPNLYNKR